MNTTINLAIQVLPLELPKEEAYRIVDEAIHCIQQSGLQSLVTPFETVVEGPYAQVMQLLEDVQEACARAGAGEVIINLKLHRNFTKPVAIGDKIDKYS